MYNLTFLYITFQRMFRKTGTFLLNRHLKLLLFIARTSEGIDYFLQLYGIHSI